MLRLSKNIYDFFWFILFRITSIINPALENGTEEYHLQVKL